MSAIAGICYWDGRPIADSDLAVLAANSRVAGPDGGGTVRPSPGLALQAHVLHFDRLSATEQQPHAFAHGSVLTWDGRLDNRDDLLVALHHHLGPDQTDAALVAAAYQRWGLECLPRLLGDWSLAIWDAATQTIVLARDYMGNRPLHYVETVGGLAWATCLHALTDCFDLYGQPNDAYIAGMLTFGVPPGLTPFRSVLSLRAGHVLVATRAHGVSVRRYWEFTPSTIHYRDPREYTQRLRELLADAVRVRLRADRTVWSHLSGGWDSSSLVCLAHALIQRGRCEAPAVQPLSFVFSNSPESDESAFIGAVERWCGLSTVRSEFRGYARFADLLRQHPLHHVVFALAYLEAPVRAGGDRILMSGEIGDGILRGGALRLGLLEPLHEGHPLRSLRLCYARALALQRNFIATVGQLALDAYLPRFRKAVTRRWHDRNRARKAKVPTRDLAQVFGVTPAVLARARQCQPPARPSVSDFSILKRPMVDTLYAVADGNFVTNWDLTLDVWHTFPYVHRPLVEFILAAPFLAVWDPQVTRLGMRRALSDVLPPEILARTTKGSPLAAEGRDLRRRAADLAETSTLSVTDWQLVNCGYLDRMALKRALGELGKDEHSTAILLDVWVPLEAWLRTLGPWRTPAGQSSSRIWSGEASQEVVTP